jgi:signal transduction histidine kinase
MQSVESVDEGKLNNMINLLNEKEVLLKEREIAFYEQEEEFLSQKEELTAAVEELMSKNSYLTSTLNKLMQRNDELDRILYRASHDLKTPVSSIYGLIEILGSAPLTPDQEKATTHLLKQMHQMEKRLTSLTDLSTAFFSKPDLRTFSLQQLAQQVWESIDVRQNVTLRCKNEDQQIHSDPSMLSIVLKCLMENSITYRDNTQPGLLEVSFEKSLCMIQTTLMDNGEGIDPAIEPKIFDMFYRGSEKATGFGLGLYIAKIIIEKLNGTIQFSSWKL